MLSDTNVMGQQTPLLEALVLRRFREILTKHTASFMQMYPYRYLYGYVMEQYRMPVIYENNRIARPLARSRSL